MICTCSPRPAIPRLFLKPPAIEIQSVNESINQSINQWSNQTQSIRWAFKRINTTLRTIDSDKRLMIIANWRPAGYRRSATCMRPAGLAFHHHRCISTAESILRISNQQDFNQVHTHRNRKRRVSKFMVSRETYRAPSWVSVNMNCVGQAYQSASVTAETWALGSPWRHTKKKKWAQVYHCPRSPPVVSRSLRSNHLESRY